MCSIGVRFMIPTLGPGCFGPEQTVPVAGWCYAMRASRRVFARSCLDWTQRRPHLAGVLPAALTQRFLADGWLIRGASRAVHTAPDYDHRLETWLTRAAPVGG
jgi:hypothetical protein